MKFSKTEILGKQMKTGGIMKFCYMDTPLTKGCE
jgi:hypothetical protein